MGKFSDYVENINEQTNLLRKNLQEATGMDCSNKSIGGCANVVANYIPELEEDDDGSYVRPSWYPNPKEILDNAPDITVDGNIYYPAYILLMDNSETQTPFYYSNNSSNIDAVNYYRGTGGSAVLCSDKCDNNISNANETTLEVGTTIMHTWDLSKDIADPSGEANYKVRWAVIYTRYTSVTPSIFGTNAIEFISGNIQISNDSLSNPSTPKKANNTLKFFWIPENTTFLKSASYSLSYYMNLQEIKLECLNTIYDANIGNYCYNLQKITYAKTVGSVRSVCGAGIYNLKTLIAPETITNQQYPTMSNVASYAYKLKYINIPTFNTTITLISCFEHCSNLKTLILSNSIITIDSNFCTDCSNLETLILPANLQSISFSNFKPLKLKYLKIPSSVTTIKNTSSAVLIYTTYIELYNDFDISGLYFNQYINKEIQWLKDLCGWLKDRTGMTANKMILGRGNIDNAKKIYLTFNPNNKREITWVDEGTEGAINIVEYITNQLNWTLGE